MAEVDVATATPTLELRVVCKSFGKVPGHHEHKFVKDSMELVERYRKKLTGDVEGTRIADVELPYRIQARLVSKWTDVPDGS
jgi:hypothetical protein